MVDLSGASARGKKKTTVKANPQLEQKVTDLEAKVEELKIRLEQHSAEN